MPTRDDDRRSQRILAGALWITLSAGCWALLCVMLDRAGHGPSKVLLPIAREGYYGKQALFVLPLLTLLWLGSATLTSCIARNGSGAYHWRETANGMGIALGAPLLCLFLLPDLVAYHMVGFSSLRVLVRFTAPLSFIASVALATRMTRRVHGLSTSKALVAGTAGVLGQAVAGAVFLR